MKDIVIRIRDFFTDIRLNLWSRRMYQLIDTTDGDEKILGTYDSPEMCYWMQIRFSLKDKRRNKSGAIRPIDVPCKWWDLSRFAPRRGPKEMSLKELGVWEFQEVEE